MLVQSCQLGPVIGLVHNAVVTACMFGLRFGQERWAWYGLCTHNWKLTLQGLMWRTRYFGAVPAFDCLYTTTEVTYKHHVAVSS